MADFSLDEILKRVAELKGSDCFISANTPIQVKVDGVFTPLTDRPLRPFEPRELLQARLSSEQMIQLDREHELNIALSLPNIGRFRLSAFIQRGTVAAVLRFITFDKPDFSTLNLPPVLVDLVMLKRGLILMAGATGTGKSTTLAALIERRNQTMQGHILTVEDPVEFLFSNKKSVVNQREVGRDTDSLHVALKNALRQAPDCILIGEIRDRETMTEALSYALSGHLVLATIHANNSYHAFSRILSFYPQEARPAMLMDLATALKAIASQRLLPRVGGGRIPAVEIMINSRLISEQIEAGNTNGLKEAMEQSLSEGSQTFESEIARLILEGKITKADGLAYADSPTNLLWRLQNAGLGAANGKAKEAPKPLEDEGPSFSEITLDSDGGRGSAVSPFPSLNS